MHGVHEAVGSSPATPTNMTKNNSEGICVYCTEPPREGNKLTVEHVIPKMFYLKKDRIDDNVSIKAPICNDCQKKSQLIQERARAWFTLLSSDNNIIAKNLIKNEIRRSIQRKPALKKIIEDKVSKIHEIKTSSGIIVPVLAATVDFKDADIGTFVSFLDLVVRGVYWDVLGRIIPKGAKIIHAQGFQNYFKPRQWVLDWVKENQNVLLYKYALPEVYLCRTNCIGDSANGVVVSLFYQTLLWSSWVFDVGSKIPEEFAKFFQPEAIRIIR